MRDDELQKFMSKDTIPSPPPGEYQQILARVRSQQGKSKKQLRLPKFAYWAAPLIAVLLLFLMTEQRGTDTPTYDQPELASDYQYSGDFTSDSEIEDYLLLATQIR